MIPGSSPRDPLPRPGQPRPVLQRVDAGRLPASEGRQWRTRAALASDSCALRHTRGSASVPRDPAQNLYSASRVLPTAAGVRSSALEPQQRRHA
jgi:hypothetical protein